MAPQSSTLLATSRALETCSSVRIQSSCDSSLRCAPHCRGTAASPQFHLSLVGASDYMLDWVTPASAESSLLLYGSSAVSLDQQVMAKAVGTVEQSAGAHVACWTALLHNVKPGATIYYALQGNATPTDTFSFTVPKTTDITWAVFGDLAAPMQKQAAAVSLPALKKELAARAFHGVLNLGDISYELVKQNGENYMEALLETTIGNHEHEHVMAPEFALQNYRRRFAGIAMGAGAASGSASNEFFSFSSGLIHFVFINTEVYGNEAFFSPQADGSWKPDEKAHFDMAARQASWLEYDLSRVDHVVTPYVVMCGHRPPFKTPLALTEPGNKFLLEIVPLISQYGVDLYLSGHEHTYLVFEESKVGEYKLPRIIISGSAGNNEFIRLEKDLKVVGFEHRTMIPKYGFGYLTATATALEWKWGSAATDSSHKPQPADWAVEDTLTIPRKITSSAAEKKGSPVKTPVAVETLWPNTAESGAHSGSKASSSGIGRESVPGTDSPSNIDSLETSLVSTPGADVDPATSSKSSAGSLLRWAGSSLAVGFSTLWMAHHKAHSLEHISVELDQTPAALPNTL